MHLGSKIPPLASALAFLSLSICLAASPQPETRTPKVVWAFGAVRTSSNPSKVERVRAHMELSSGDKLRMMIQLNKRCFVYVIHRDTQDNLVLLFPYSIKQFDTDYQTFHKYFSPKDGWFQLDNRTGRETFYLVASDQRLLDIEYAYQQYASSISSKKQDLAKQVISELEGMAGKHLASSVAADMPADAVARGFERAMGADPMDISQVATEISFETSYSETFVIDHR